MPLQTVPAPTTIPASEPTVRGILLVEPYGALGIALSSALRKFAPHHAIRVTPSLADAETATETIRPELFVLDLDPAPGGEIDFFNRLRERHGETRVLVIAASPLRELRSVRGPAGALQFIAKPFDLADFGASVQALLGPWTTPATASRRGTLRNLHVLDIVQLKCLARSTTVICVESPEGRVGEIHLHHGEIVHASNEDSSGFEALEEITGWPHGKITETGRPKGAPTTIDHPWQILLQEIAPQLDEPDSLGENVPETAAPPAQPRKSILVIDDTEMLRIFAADVLRTADRTFDVATASTGAEGLELAAAKRPDLVLLDYSLTDMNGDEVCRRLLENETTARIPVLMMSGHVPELKNTAANFGNVVAILAKPFLSGALINEVEKILAAGPLKEVSTPPVAPPAMPPPIASQPLPNGYSTGSNGGGFGATGSSPSATLAMPPPEAAAPPTSRLPPNEPPQEITAEQREVSAAFACDVISVQLASDFRMVALQLKPADEVVLVQMRGAGDSSLLSSGKDFRLGPVQLSSDGRIETLRLIPAQLSEHASANGGNFAVHQASAQSSDREHLHEFNERKGAPMRVKLVAEFNLLGVDLSETFGIDAVVLQSQNNCVRVQTGNNSSVAMQFFIHDVQLDEVGHLRSLIVGSRR